MDNAQIPNSYFGMYRGKVLDNDDPKMLGRVRAEIYPMLVGVDTAESNFESAIVGIETEALPWAVPAASLSESSAEGFGCIAVPKIDSFLFFFFENGNVYQPVYFASAPTAIHGLPEEIQTNYPNKKVFKTSSGFIISIDETEDEEVLLVEHPSGSFFSFLADGSATVSAVRVNILASERISSQVNAEQIIIDSESGIEISTTKNVVITAAQIHHNKYEETL